MATDVKGNITTLPANLRPTGATTAMNLTWASDNKLRSADIDAIVDKMRSSKTIASLKIIYADAYTKFNSNKGMQEQIIKVYEEMKSKCT